jgi:hypothetical protein
MKNYLWLLLKTFVVIFWLLSTVVGINLINQNVVWQNWLGVLILCLSLFSVVYYIKNYGRELIKNIKEDLFNKK